MPIHDGLRAQRLLQLYDQAGPNGANHADAVIDVLLTVGEERLFENEHAWFGVELCKK